jgi:hypothetical protein
MPDEEYRCVSVIHLFSQLMAGSLVKNTQGERTFPLLIS